MLKTESGSSGSSGFPITLGNTVITASSTTTTLSNLTLNNVVINGTTENNISFSNVNVLSGNIANVTISNSTVVNANITSVSATFPNSFLANSTAAIGNATVTLGSTTSTVGNLTLGNANITSVASTFPNSYLSNSSVTIGNTSVALGSTVTSLGNLTLANVTINGGTITDNTVTANAFIAIESISPSLSAGAFSYGTLGYSDVNIFASYSTNSNNYAQIILQNINPGGNSSSDFVVSNDKGAANGYYGDFGMNSSGFNGTGSLNLPNATYVYGVNSDVVIGTASANAVHILANGSVTDAITVYANNTAYIANVTIAAGTQNVQTINHTATTTGNATYSTSSLLLVPAGFIEYNLNGTVVKIPYYAV